MTRPPELPGYTYVRPLGSGGYADVFLYQQQLPSRAVAVKVLKEAALTSALREQFTAEANTMAGLAGHPNIVPVFAADVAADGRAYLVMMYYPRPNLGVRAASERLSVSEVLRVGVQVASAVETAHRAGILHRDIKPANILTSQYGAPGLTDFGIAAQLARADEDDDTGVSVPWSAPEVLYSTAPPSVRSDVYSLAATLWNLLVGRSPFERPDGDNSPYALMARIRDLAPPATGRADVPEALDRLLRQAMAKDPAARPGSALEFARRLQTVEQSLQLARTEIVVLVEGADGRDHEGPPAAAAGVAVEATRRRAAPTVIAQPGLSPQQPVTPAARGPVTPAAAPPTVARPKRHAGRGGASPDGGADPVGTGRVRPPRARDDVPADPTVRRPTVVSDPGVAPEPEQEPRARHPLPWLLGAAAAAVIVVVLAALGVFSGGPASPHPVATVGASTGPQDAGVAGDALPPGTPHVVAARAGRSVVFTWTYSAALANDSFQWRFPDGSRSGVVDRPTLSIADPAAAVVCIQVKVVRADGSNGSPAWSPRGCGR